MKIPKIEKTQNGQYYCRLRVGGQSISVYGNTEKECREQATLIKAKHKAGQLEEKHGGLTLTKAIDQYIVDRQNVLSPSTIKGYRMIQRCRFQSSMGNSLQNINWQRVINLEAQKCSAKTLKNAWGFIASVLRENNVDVPKVALPQVIRNERGWLEPDDIWKFIDALDGSDCELEALLALHGLRCSEIYGLTWDSIDLKKQTITVRGAVVQSPDGGYEAKATNKNVSSQRTVPIMIPRLAELLADRIGGELATGYPGSLYRRINRVCKAAELPEVGAHGLRHSFASLAYHLGMPERECMRLGGWSDTQTMHKIYTHIAEKDVQKYANEMANFYTQNKNAK